MIGLQRGCTETLHDCKYSQSQRFGTIRCVLYFYLPDCILSIAWVGMINILWNWTLVIECETINI